VNTSDVVVELLKNSKEPMRTEEIAEQLNKGSANVRKILSNLARKGKIERVAYGLYSVNAGVNVESESVNAEEIAKRAYREYMRNWSAQHKERVREYQKQWRAKNREKVREYQRQWRAQHRDKIKVYQKRYWIKRGLRAGVVE
jgi:predicted transcriptional regulator